MGTLSGMSIRLKAILLAAVLAVSGCAQRDEVADEPAADGAVKVTLTADALTVPATIPGGVIEIEFDSKVDEGELNLTRVKAGTTGRQFKEAISKVVSGGAFPEFLEATAGITASEKGVSTHSIQVEPGDHFAWSIPESQEGPPPTAAASPEAEQGPSPADVLARPVKVTAAAGGTLPAGDGTITARDYTFDVDVKPGGTYTFRNAGPKEFHHVVVFDFATVDPKVVERELPKFLESEGEATPPPALAGVDMENLQAGGSGVFSPNLGGTFEASFKSGRTYALVCFINDKAGGPPHAFAHDMRKVFVVA